LFVVFTNGIATGQETSQVSEHLAPYNLLLGNWRYEEALLEDLPGVAEKGSKCVIQFSWRRILQKNVVMEDWFVEIEGGSKLSGKSLIGRNAADEKIAFGGMTSLGGMSIGSMEFDRQAKTFTISGKGVDGEGEKTTFKNVITKTGKDKFTWQALERSGGLVEGESPVYTFTRVKRAAGKEAAK
jgi:hypothetical protein